MMDDDNVIPMPLPSLRNMSMEQLKRFVGTNPRKWAKAFLEIYEADEDAVMNEDWVTAWFTAAMEAAKQ